MNCEFKTETCDVSIILPTFNEEGNIAPLFDAIDCELSNLNYEIIVIDDNSHDGTAEIVKKLKNTKVKLISNCERQGLAKSILVGISQARGESLVIMDSDFNHQPSYLKFMLSSLDYYDCVSASRFLSKTSMANKVRGALTAIFNTVTRVMIDGSMTDYFYGYIAIKRERLVTLDLERIFYGYGDYYLRLINGLERGCVPILEFAAINGQRYSGVGNRNLVGVFFKYAKEVFLLTYRLRFKT